MKLYICLFFVFFKLQMLADNASIKALNKAINLYETNDGKKYIGSDALALRIRKNLDIDIYTGENSIYFEWDEKNYVISAVNIYRDNFDIPVRIIKNRAFEIGHKWNGYVSHALEKNHTYVYKVEMVLQSGEKVSQKFMIKTKNGDRNIHKKVFKIYDNLDGTGRKSNYLNQNSKDKTMREFGLENSAMFWVDDFFSPIPSTKDADINRILTKPQLKTLQKLVLEKVNSKYPHKEIDKNGGFINLDIEHLPTIVSYVEREFSPYGSFITRFYNDPLVTQNGRKIVSEAIAKKLKCIKAVKEILPLAQVGLWDSVVPWNRYSKISDNKDHIALAKSIDNSWLVNYDEWHKKDSMIYKEFIDVIDYVSPALYPAFDLSHEDGKKRMLGFMMSKLMEIKRLNPDTVVIPAISPQYTESWADELGYNKKPLQKGVFTWYINQLYTLYKEGYIDSILIWGDNHKTSFIDYTKQDWWGELLQFFSDLKRENLGL